MQRVSVATSPKFERSAFWVEVALCIPKLEPLRAFAALDCVPHRVSLEKPLNALGSAISPQPSRDAFKLVSSEIYFASGSLKIQPTNYLELNARVLLWVEHPCSLTHSR